MINTTILDMVNLTDNPAVPLTVPNELTSGLFMTLILFFIWIAIIGGTYFYNKKTTQQGNIHISFATSGFVTIVIALLLRIGLKTGDVYINSYALSFSFGAFIIGLIFLFFSGLTQR